MANAIISTAQPAFLEVGPISLTSPGVYDAANVTATAPSTTGASALILSPGPNYPSLLKLTPFCGANNYTAGSVGIRVVGWNYYVERSGANIGRKVYVPNVLADLTLGYTTGTVQSLSIEGATAFFPSSVTVGAAVPTVNVYSPATAATGNVQPCHAIVDMVGSQYVTLQFKATGTNPTMGAFYSFI